MRNRSRIPAGCTWVNYLRCHDDIGWSFDDDDAKKVGIDPNGHRKFLNQFYTGNYPGSLARGVPFQFNPDTGDVRVSGTLSSLAGLEEAVAKADNKLIEKWLLKQRELFKKRETLIDLALDRDTISGIDPDITKDKDHNKSLLFSKYAPWVFFIFWTLAVVWSTLRVCIGL